MMTITETRAATLLNSEAASIAFAALLGLSLLFVTGFASASAIHDTTHDVRHAIGFACH